MTGPLAILPRNKDGHKTVTDFLTGFQEGDHVARACGTLHLQVITIVIVVSLQGLNDEVVDCVCVSACGEEGGGEGEEEKGRRGGGGEGEKRRRRRKQEYKLNHKHLIFLLRSTYHIAILVPSSCCCLQTRMYYSLLEHTPLYSAHPRPPW